eukprot:TRINITY_DN7686_c0_g4_i1.p1 TRINITY_DN7686_c0_g4~~TRINITY_DN7686_c0_g4_i1.p1  ORF type:complete len:281 (-),score=30.17 TRINITY_DN7686_c0_g4_i1:187-1029(-)
MSFQSLHVGVFLRSSEMARFQGVDTWTRASINECAVWRTIIQRELPQFEVVDGLWRDVRLAPLIVKCFGFLSDAILATKCVVKIETASDLERLEACLRKAATTKVANVAAGRRIAYVLVGDFRFTRHGGGTRFPFASDEAHALGGLPAGELEVKVCCTDEGSVLLGAKYYAVGRPSRVAMRAGALAFTTNLFSVNHETKVSFRQGHLAIDGTLRDALHGLRRIAPSQEADHLTGSSLCVVTLTEGPPTGPSELAAALGIDAPSTYKKAYNLNTLLLQGVL